MASRIAVLASGRGSNLGAIVRHLERPSAPAGVGVALVLSDRAEAGALELAHAHRIEAVTISGSGEAAGSVVEMLRARTIDLVVLAGYVKLVPTEVVRAYRGRMLNVHPALLPAFGGVGMYGPRVHRAVLESGARVSGATVHFVDEVYDRGAIIAQWPVPVFRDDTPETLAARVLRVEHALLPAAVEAVATGVVRLAGSGVEGAGMLSFDNAAYGLRPFDDGALAAEVVQSLH
jgi:phosphoribosylglycinamide formyltransferase-1